MHLKLGEDIQLSVPLAVGTLQWGTTYLDQRVVNRCGCLPEATAQEIVSTLASGQVTLFDTAEGYGGGTSEARLRRVCQGHDVVFMTKFLPTFWRFTMWQFEAALRASNRRLGVECCPIYLLHSPVHYRPIEFWVEAAAICKRKGLLQSVGLSNCNADQVRRAHKAGVKFGVPVVVNQVMYNLLDYGSDKLREMEKACNDVGIMVLAYSPIGQGLLTDGLTKDKFNSIRPAKMMGVQWDQLQALREKILTIAQARKKSMAQVVINWNICHGTVPLIGCRSVSQAKDTLGALGWSLSDEEVESLDKLALRRSTLESPTWRRSIFVTLAGVFMMACRLCDWLGFGMVKEAV